MELIQPIQEQDIGIWRIFFVRSQNFFHSGCVFNVGNVPITETPEIIHIVESAERKLNNKIVLKVKLHKKLRQQLSLKQYLSL